MFLRLVRRSEVSVAALIPNLLTTLALCCGLASIHFSAKAAVATAMLRGQGVSEDVINSATLWLWERALAAILLSAIFDALDGRAARLLRVTSKFGAVLDSLSDFVSFGVAPAMILHERTLAPLINPVINQGGVRGANIFGLMTVMTFALCSALRLARFTSAAAPTKPSHSNFFVGMPTPAAAGAVLIPALIDVSKTVDWDPPLWLVIVYTLFISFLMISRIPMFSLKKIRVSRYAVAPILALVGILVATMVYDPWLTLAIIGGLYLLSLPFAVIMRRRQRLHEPEGAPEAGVA
jgi:CDP-diacylglycerol--serine O-phosphatidyltransferase